MNQTLKKVLMGQENNHMLPFFWQHGEDEATLREYMKAIYEANCRAVCVESRPHPDFAGPKWWQDMDVILDEARKRDMKVWILDDRHFPTGFANGLIPEKYPHLLGVYMLNPITPVINLFRSAFLGAEMYPIYYNAVSLLITCAVTLLGVILFSHTEKTFMDTV